MEALKTTDKQTDGATFKKIFNWHNGLMIEDHLNNLTDSDFELLDDDLYCSYKFVNSFVIACGYAICFNGLSALG